MTFFPIFVMPKQLNDPSAIEIKSAPVKRDCNGRADAIWILKNSNKLSAVAKQYLSESLILGVIAAEDARMHWYERIVDGGGLGPGQMYEPAHRDVVSNLGDELDDFISRVNACLAGQGEPSITKSTSWEANVKDTRLANFFIAGYLALCVQRAQKRNRSAEDALRYGIVFFHGARDAIVAIQQKANISKFNKDEAIPWADVENYINKSGDSKQRDILQYVKTVLSGG